MPTYVAICPHCESEADFIRKVDDRDDTPLCCGAKMVRQGAWYVAPDISAMAFTGHKGMVVHENGQAKWLETGADYKRFIKENNKLVGEEAVQEAEHQRKNIQAADKKARRQAVIEAVKKHST